MERAQVTLPIPLDGTDGISRDWGVAQLDPTGSWLSPLLPHTDMNASLSSR